MSKRKEGDLPLTPEAQCERSARSDSVFLVADNKTRVLYRHISAGATVLQQYPSFLMGFSLH